MKNRTLSKVGVPPTTDKKNPLGFFFRCLLQGDFGLCEITFVIVCIKLDI